MATLTIRNLPDQVHERLKEQAKRNRRSLNQEVIAELELRVLEGDVAAKKQRVADLITRAAELRAELIVPLTTEEIRAGIEEGRR
jgi:plasmid stability protein